MFIKEVKNKRKNGTEVTYLHLVDSVWDPEKKSPRHKLIKSLGRKDQIDQKAIRRLINNLNRYLDPSIRDQGVIEDVLSSKSFGIPYLLDELWKKLGIQKFFCRDLAARKFEVPMERAIFSMVAQRVCRPDSKLQCEEWIEKHAYLPGNASMGVHNLYRAMDYLHEHSKELERELFLRLNDLLELDLSVVFYDTTALYFEIPDTDDEDGIRQRGHEKRDNPDHCPQVVVGLAINRSGIPIRHWVWPGNVTDVTTVKKVIRDLKGLRPRRFFFIGDRGMISSENIDYLESRGLKYILGAKLTPGSFADQLLGIRGRFTQVNEGVGCKQRLFKEGDREVLYILCQNESTKKRDQETRREILSYLSDQLKRPRAPQEGSAWSKKMLGHTVYGQYLKVNRDGRLRIDKSAARKRERLDGKYALVSNDLEMDVSVMVNGYRDLYKIERSFRTMKGALDTRPIYHRTENRIRTHIYLCVLAYTLMKVAEHRTESNWSSLEQLLSPLPAIKVQLKDGIAIHRGALDKTMIEAYRKIGIKPPPKVVDIL